MPVFPSKPNALKDIFAQPKPLIGTIHCLPFPGSPQYEGEPVEGIVEHAVAEALRYAEGGLDGVIVENGWDLPFSRPEDIGFETMTTMAVVANAVRQTCGIPIGVNLLANGAIAGLAVSKAVQAKFIRVNQWVNAYVANEGFIQGESARALRYRSFIRGKSIRVLADVHVKHGAHAIVADRSVEEQSGDVEFFDADVAIATGQRTGDATPVSEIKVVRSGTTLPVIIGSGLDAENAGELMREADGAIVGSSLKHDGVWWNKVDVARVRALVKEVDKLRREL